jgi:hypothetical protein
MVIKSRFKRWIKRPIFRIMSLNMKYARYITNKNMIFPSKNKWHSKKLMYHIYNKHQNQLITFSKTIYIIIYMKISI